MIKVDIITAMATWLTLSISFLFLLWISTRSKDRYILEDFGENYQCPYCTYIFTDYAKKNFLKCPRCKSLITRTEDKEKTTQKIERHIGENHREKATQDFIRSKKDQDEKINGH